MVLLNPQAGIIIDAEFICGVPMRAPSSTNSQPRFLYSIAIFIIIALQRARIHSNHANTE